MKVTVPVAVRLESGWLTVAVKIADPPAGSGFWELARVSVVVAVTRATATEAVVTDFDSE